MHAYSIRDSKAAGSNIPFFAATKATAMRDLKMGLAEQRAMRKFASDFQLFEVGSWDPASGILTGYPEAQHVCDITELVEHEERDDDTSEGLQAVE